MKEDVKGDGVISQNNRIGQLFIESKLVTAEQLSIALKRQSQTGERIGSVLLELGYLSTESLLDFLTKHFGTPSTDLFRLHIEPAVLKVLTYEQIRRLKVLPISNSSRYLFLAMADPNDMSAIKELEFSLGRNIQAIVVPHTQMEAALRCLEKRGGVNDEPLAGPDIEREHTERLIPDDLGLKQLLKLLITRGASDLLISAGVAPCLKVNNEIMRLPGKEMTPGEVERIALEMMTETQKSEFAERGEIDFALSSSEVGRFRVNTYRQRNSISIAVRNVIESVPSIASLGLPDWVEDYALKPQGLILITGPTGHGKSTTLAALVNVINSRRKCNIITIEDPIEFLHKHKLSNINQREVGRDTSSFHEGLRNIFRQAPDVIVVGEMRDPESFAIAIQAAETGHLVLSTLHANSGTSTLERIIEIFTHDKQQQIRVQIAESFLLILNQRLVHRKDGNGRVLAYEKLANSTRIKNLIRDGKTYQIRTLFQQSVEEYQPLDMSLARLVRDGTITLDEGLKFCENPMQLKALVTDQVKARH